MRSYLKEEKEKEKEDRSFLGAATQLPSKCQPHGLYSTEVHPFLAVKAHRLHATFLLFLNNSFF